MLPHRLLLLEDNEDNLIVYSTILRHFGYEVLEAITAEEAVALAVRELPDLVVADRWQPLGKEWEAASRIRHDPRTAHIPIIGLSAGAMHVDREAALAAGCDAYLVKPCEPRAVVAEVRRLLGERGGREEQRAGE